MSFSPCDLRACIEQVCSRAEATVPGLTIARIIDPRVPRQAGCDARALEEMLGELLDGALRSAPASPVTVVAYEIDDPHRSVLRFEVRDRGGPPEWPTNPKLAQLARRLEGEVVVRQLEGLGATSWFTVGLATQAPAWRTDPSINELPPLAILVVEDNVVNQHSIRTCLQDLGCGCEIVADGRAAVAAVTAGTYDVIFMDIHMPVMDGIAATRAIRRLPGGTAVYISAFTAYALPGDRARCIDAGMDDYVAKPCRPDSVAAVLCRAAARMAR